MLAKIGLFALALLIGAESFVASASVLWPIAALAHLGQAAQAGALIVAALLGVAAAVWIVRRSLSTPPESL